MRSKKQKENSKQHIITPTPTQNDASNNNNERLSIADITNTFENINKTIEEQNLMSQIQNYSEQTKQKETEIQPQKRKNDVRVFFAKDFKITVEFAPRTDHIYKASVFTKDGQFKHTVDIPEDFILEKNIEKIQIHLNNIL